MSIDQYWILFQADNLDAPLEAPADADNVRVDNGQNDQVAEIRPNDKITENDQIYQVSENVETDQIMEDGQPNQIVEDGQNGQNEENGQNDQAEEVRWNKIKKWPNRQNEQLG